MREETEKQRLSKRQKSRHSSYAESRFKFFIWDSDHLRYFTRFFIQERSNLGFILIKESLLSFLRRQILLFRTYEIYGPEFLKQYERPL